MTTDEIKKMIADTLQGQGNQVDIGGGIPKILNAIVEKIDEGGGGGGTSEPIQLSIDRDRLESYRVSGTGVTDTFDAIPKSAMIEILGVTEDELNRIMMGNAGGNVIDAASGDNVVYSCENFGEYEGGKYAMYSVMQTYPLFNQEDYSFAADIQAMSFSVNSDGIFKLETGHATLPFSN